MCGIAVDINRHLPVDPEAFRRKLGTLHHRGPDDAGTWFSADGRVAIGNCRLAILDLSPKGHMPMGDDSGKVQITYNGEVYNFGGIREELENRGHRFRGTSDTEVVLKAYLEWGVDCVERLNGMFAFAIFDSRKECSSRGTLFLARDRAGEKPLYYYVRQGRFCCASELKALMADSDIPRQLDLRSFNFFLALGYVPGERSILSHVEKLSPATAALYDLEKGTLETWRYWSLPEPAEEKVADIGSIVEDLETLLLNSVRHRLVADVPVGILLSGGVDSSLITAAAARVSSSRLQTFTVSFPGNGSFDETAYARRIANYFGTEHHELEFETNLVSLLPEMATIFDEPLADSSLVPTYAVSRLARRHVTVALGGDGGDELFGGYPTYRRNVGWRGVLESLPHYLKRPISIMAKRWMPLGMRGRQHLHSIGGNTRDNFILRSLIFDVYTRRRLLQSSIWQSLTEYSEEPEQYKISLWAVNEMASVERMSRLDFATHLPDDILVKVDRASMAVSLELRSPWLDREILEFAFGKLPVSLKVEKNVGRIIQRRLAKSLLPLDFDLNRKQGFSIPPRVFRGNGWSDICNDLLTHADSELFNRTTILGLLALARLRPSVSGYLFPLVMFEFWRRHYRISPPGLPEGNH